MLHRLIRYSSTFAACMSPTLNGSFALQRFKCGNVVELHWMMFDFYRVLCRNQSVMYFECINHLWSTVSLNFRWGWCAHLHHKYIKNLLQLLPSASELYLLWKFSNTALWTWHWMSFDFFTGLPRVIPLKILVYYLWVIPISYYVL